MTEAPQYYRVLGERRTREPETAVRRWAWRGGRGRGSAGAIAGPPQMNKLLRAGRAVTDGNGFVFVDHVGNICPSGFLPVPASNVREHPLFVALRDPARLGGRCGRCECRLRCGGSRARAYAFGGDALAEDPGCAYQPAPRGSAA